MIMVEIETGGQFYTLPMPVEVLKELDNLSSWIAWLNGAYMVEIEGIQGVNRMHCLHIFLKHVSAADVPWYQAYNEVRSEDYVP